MREIKRTANHSFLPLGICTLCNMCPCRVEDYQNDHTECGIDRNNVDIYELNSIYFSPNCQLVNIRYTKDDKPGHHLFIPEQVKLVKEDKS